MCFALDIPLCGSICAAAREGIYIISNAISIYRICKREAYQCTLDYDLEEGLANRHWHPQDTAEALNYVVAFAEGTIV